VASGAAPPSAAPPKVAPPSAAPAEEKGKGGAKKKPK
jgi:hypothetical protein